jgi:isobutyryl-CoA mutase
VDPTRKKGQGALLGDRIRLGSASYPGFFIRSLATRDSRTELSPKITEVVSFLRGQQFDLIMVESSGIGQAADEITKVADYCLYVMTPEYGAASQLEKIEMLESADLIVLNKFEKPRAEDALRDVRKQYRRNHQIFPGHPEDVPNDQLPVFATMASKFNDRGINALFSKIVSHFSLGTIGELKGPMSAQDGKQHIIAPERALYLRDISSACKNYRQETKDQLSQLDLYHSLLVVAENIDEPRNKQALKECRERVAPLLEKIEQLDKLLAEYRTGKFSYTVRDKEYQVNTKFTSLSHLEVSKVALPKLTTAADKYRFLREQNLPGFFPFAAGIFPFKRADEDPKRMFAGEGGPKRTNKRFHYLSANDPAKRLSTAFDSVTLYGDDPNKRPDIFGKIGEAGVSIATLDDMDDLFAGFNLVDPNTSVSMTINGPAPIILAMFMNTAIKQQLTTEERSNPDKCLEIMRQVRGTVQADILKEDQAQNTCIFSLEFALRMMGDVQEYFCQNKIKNYYTVSISGYHIAEAGANPISQLAFTLANGFTYVEYYLSRGMKIDEFCGNLSYFFSNGLDPEYTVLGRVARKIWAITMRDKYGANAKSQRFKYHVQTSGRSLHAQEIDFNDIRTTLQAFLALSDNCNSLHTNAYDEAITTPTEESVRRAMAIQMIIGKEFGMNKCDNPLQGSYLYEELSDLVEEAVLNEFESISDRGGVLGAMESMYQRSKIQEESLHYESLKDSGQLPIIGVNTYLSEQADLNSNDTIELSRCSDSEKQDQIDRLDSFHQRNQANSSLAKKQLIQVILDGGNVFAELLNTVRYCSLGEITEVLYQLGGRYRRNM